MADTVKRTGKTFSGMAFPDTHPSTVDNTYVRRTHMLDIPALLRVHAYGALGDLSGDEWWTIGEFRYEGEDYDTAVARRILRNGRMAVEFGIERDCD